MLAALAIGILGQTASFKPNAEVGKAYLLGGKRYVSGSKQIIDAGTEMWATVHGVRSALFFPTEFEDYLAESGQKLFLIDATIKNPSKVVYNVGPNGPFGIRVSDPKGKAEDYRTLGVTRKDLKTLQARLKQGESVDITVVLRAPATVETCRVGFYFNQDRNNTRWYDLTSHVEKSASKYCKSGFFYGESAVVEKGQSADFDWLDVRALGFRNAENNEYIVDVELKNRSSRPAKWGWQYAAAQMSAESGSPVDYYRQLYDKEGKMWAGDVPAGGSSIVEYRFYPSRSIDPKSITLTSATTKRTLFLKL